MIEKKVHFLAGTIPAGAWPAVCEVLNWADKNKFEVVSVINTMVMNTPTVKSVRAAPYTSMFYIYCSANPKSFSDYFGFEYTTEKVMKIPELIGQIEKKKNGKQTAPGGPTGILRT